MQASLREVKSTLVSAAGEIGEASAAFPQAAQAGAGAALFGSHRAGPSELQQLPGHPTGAAELSHSPPGCGEENTCLPFSRPGISTERREGGMSLVARTQSPSFFSFLYSTRKDWMGNPPFPRGIQVTYTDVSDAMEMVGRSGASGAAKVDIKDMKHAPLTVSGGSHSSEVSG